MSGLYHFVSFAPCASIKEAAYEKVDLDGIGCCNILKLQFKSVDLLSPPRPQLEPQNTPNRPFQLFVQRSPFRRPQVHFVQRQRGLRHSAGHLGRAGLPAALVGPPGGGGAERRKKETK